MNGPWIQTLTEKYYRFKDIHGEKAYISVIRMSSGVRHRCCKAFVRARDAVAYRERVLERYNRLREASS